MIAVDVPSEPAGAVIARDVVLARGPDCTDFLHGQLSQDIASMSTGDSGWALLLQPRGKVDAWLRITRTGDDSFLLDVDAGFGEAMLERLTRFKLRTDCEFELAKWSMLSVRGEGSAGFDSTPVSGVEVTVPSDWPGIDGIDLLGPSISLPTGLAPLGSEGLDLLRILAGVPAMGTELTEDTIPAEAGIVELSVSFTKGCYVGQELVARIDSRGGNVPRRLCGLVADADVALGAQVLVDGETVGQVTSAQGSHALAYVKRSVAELPAQALIGDLMVEIRALPMS